MSEEEIVAKSVVPKRVLYVYFLIKDNKIVYVGKTAQLDHRMLIHAGQKDFDRYSIIRCKDEEEQSDLELEYIIKFNPLYNGKVPPNDKYISFDGIKKRLNIKAVELRRVFKKHGIQPTVWGMYYKAHEVDEALGGGWL